MSDGSDQQQHEAMLATSRKTPAIGATNYPPSSHTTDFHSQLRELLPTSVLDLFILASGVAGPAAAKARRLEKQSCPDYDVRLVEDVAFGDLISKSRDAPSTTAEAQQPRPSFPQLPPPTRKTIDMRNTVGAKIFPILHSSPLPATRKKSVGICVSYLHASPADAVRSFFSYTSPLFLLPAGKNPPKDQLKAGSSSTRSSAGPITGILNPQILRDDPVTETKIVLLYKQLHSSSRIAVELFLRVSLALGPSESVEAFDGAAATTDVSVAAVFFESVGVEELGADEALIKAVAERRAFAKTVFTTVVQGHEVGCLVLLRNAIGCSNAQMVLQAQYDDIIQEDTCLTLLRQSFTPVKAAQKKYERCEAVDELMRRYFVFSTMPKTPGPNEEERAMVEKAMPSSLDELHWQRVRGSLRMHPTVHMFTRKEVSPQGKTVIVGKCCGDIDGALDFVFAWLWFGCSYERMRTHREKHGDLLRVTDASDHESRSQVICTEQKIAPAIANCCYETKLAWITLESGDIAVAFAPSNKVGAALFTAGAVRASTSGIYLLRKGTLLSTNMTLIQRVQLGFPVPNWVMKTLITSSFSLVLRMQEKFKRPDKVVDEDVRAALAAKIKASAVRDRPGEEDIFEPCNKLAVDFENKSTRHVIQPLQSTSPFVGFSVRHAQKDDQSRGIRPVATGKATAEIDTSIEVAAAWLFEVCSREQMMINNEDNAGLPRIIVSKKGGNILVAGTLRLMPFPLYTREFVTQMAWWKLEGDKIAIVVRSIGDAVDYGMAKRGVVRGSTISFQVLEKKTGANSCSTVLYRNLDPGGIIPVAIVNSKVVSSLSAVDELRIAFQRDEEVDVERRRAMASELFRSECGATLDKDDEDVVNTVAEELRVDTSAAQKTIDGISDHFVKVFLLSHVFVAEVIVDADLEECVAWLLLKCSRQRSQSFYDNDGGATKIEKAISSRRRETTEVFTQHQQGRMVERQIVSESLWKKVGFSSFVIVEKQRGVPSRARLRRQGTPKLNVSLHLASETTCDAIDKLVGTFSQTKVVTRFALGQEHVFQNEWVACATRYLSDMRLCFDMSCEIDLQRRREFCERVRSNAEVYDKDEEEMIAETLSNFVMFDQRRAHRLKMSSPTIEGRSTYKPGDRHVWGWSSGIVRASSVEVLAYIWDFLKRAAKRPDDMEKAVDETRNMHDQVVFVKKRTPKIISDRDFLSRALWKATSSGGFNYVSLPVEDDEKRPRNVDGVVRATYLSALKLVSSGNSETRVEYLIRPDWGGDRSMILLSNFYVRANLSYVREIQLYFQRLRRRDVFDGKDGMAVGEDFMLESKEEQEARGRNRVNKHEIRVASVVKRHVALKELVSYRRTHGSLPSSGEC